MSAGFVPLFWPTSIRKLHRQEFGRSEFCVYGCLADAISEDRPPSDRDPFPLLTSDDALAVHAAALTTLVRSASEHFSKIFVLVLDLQNSLAFGNPDQDFFLGWRSPQRVNTQGQSRHGSGSATGFATEPRRARNARRIPSRCGQSRDRSEKEEIASGRSTRYLGWRAFIPGTC